jgi:PAS domain S-box-containing protein
MISLPDALDRAPCGYLRLRDDGVILSANRTLCAMLGHEPGELDGRSFDVLLSAGARVFCQTHFFPLLRLKGQVEEIYFNLRTKDGGALPMLVNASRHATSEGNVNELVVMRMTLRNQYEDELLRARKAADEANREKDIAMDAQRKVEAELRTSSERLTIATAVAGISVGEIDMTSNMIHLSREAARIFGLGDDAITVPRQRVHDTFHEEELDQFFEQLRKAQDPSGNGVFALEHRILQPDGTVKWVSARKQIHFDRTVDPPQPVRGVLVIQDITVRKQLEAELHLAHRRKDEFIATIAHELRNPLATIKSGLDVLAIDDLESVVRTETQAMMERQAALVMRLVDDLMDLNRISHGKVALRMEPFDLKEAIMTAVEATAVSYAAKDHRLEVHVPPIEWMILGDRERMTQVVNNLLGNAAKYTPSGGRIKLSLAEENGNAVLRVKDDGIGIDPRDLPLVFELFAQLGDPTSAGGLGIGLNIVKRLVELHNGQVSAHSEGQGKGSEFKVLLPMIAHYKTSAQASVIGSAER